MTELEDIKSKLGTIPKKGVVLFTDPSTGNPKRKIIYDSKLDSLVVVYL